MAASALVTLPCNAFSTPSTSDGWTLARSSTTRRRLATSRFAALSCSISISLCVSAPPSQYGWSSWRRRPTTRSSAVAFCEATIPTISWSTSRAAPSKSPRTRLASALMASSGSSATVATALTTAPKSPRDNAVATSEAAATMSAVSAALRVMEPSVSCVTKERIVGVSASTASGTSPSAALAKSPFIALTAASVAPVGRPPISPTMRMMPLKSPFTMLATT